MVFRIRLFLRNEARAKLHEHEYHNGQIHIPKGADGSECIWLAVRLFIAYELWLFWEI